MPEYPKWPMEVTVDTPIKLEVDLIFLLVKTVDAIREDKDIPDAMKKKAVDGVEDVIRAVKHKYGNQKIVGNGSIIADPQEIFRPLVAKLNGGG